MRSILKYLLLTYMSALFLSCSNRAGFLGDKDCRNHLSRANYLLNDYYINGNENYLNLSLSIIDSVFTLCPENKGQFVSLKITLLTLLKDYDKGVNFVNTLDEDGFDKSYKRNMYLNTFKALSFEAKGDTIQRNVLFKELAHEIESYVNKNPTDKRAITDLFFTKIRFIPQEIVIKEIDEMQENAGADKDFYEALKESIEFAPMM